MFYLFHATYLIIRLTQKRSKNRKMIKFLVNNILLMFNLGYNTYLNRIISKFYNKIMFHISYIYQKNGIKFMFVI